ncbi:MAG: glycosyltransferase family 2 protein [Gemmatimonadaceae bacterium]
MTQIAVAIVNYNTIGDLRNCLATVRAAGATEIVLKDNGSTDGSVEMVEREFSEVRVLDSRDNPGYGAASNQAIAACRAPYVLLLNSDILLAPETLDVLVEYLDAHPRAAIVGPRLRNPDGTLQRSAHAFPRPVTLRPVVRHIPGLRDRSLLTWPHDQPRVVQWVKGAALAIRRTAFDAVSGFDPAFFMYFEETDLCYRLHEAGWEIHFTPATTIVHKGGASTEQMRADMAVQFYASMRQFYRYHYPTADLRRLDAVLRLQSRLALARDRARLLSTRDPRAAAILADDVRVWRRVLAGDWPVRPTPVSAPEPQEKIDHRP